MLDGNDTGIHPVAQFRPLPYPSSGQLDPDPFPVFYREFLGRLGMDLHQGIRVLGPLRCDLSVFRMKERLDLCPRNRDQWKLAGKLVC